VSLCHQILAWTQSSTWARGSAARYMFTTKPERFSIFVIFSPQLVALQVGQKSTCDNLAASGRMLSPHILDLFARPAAPQVENWKNNVPSSGSFENLSQKGKIWKNAS